MRRTSFATGLAALALIVGYRALRPWHERWGATDEEVVAPLPGDELIPEAASQTTRAISIDASTDEVWRWLIQIGAERGGFYSYDWLEDLFGLDIHSATDVVEEWQSREVGDFVHGDAKGRGGWYVMDVQPGRALVLQTADLNRGRPASCRDGAVMEFTWAFVLREKDDGATRLLVRERVAFRNGLVGSLMSPVGLVSFVMTQKMVRGIRERAESSIRSAETSVLAASLG